MSQRSTLALCAALVGLAGARTAAATEPDDPPIPTVEKGLRAWRIQAFNELFRHPGTSLSFEFRSGGSRHWTELSYTRQGHEDVREVEGGLLVRNVGIGDYEPVEDLQPWQLERYEQTMAWATKRYFVPDAEPARLARVRAYRAAVAAGAVADGDVRNVWDVRHEEPDVDQVSVARVGEIHYPDGYLRPGWDGVGPIGPAIRAALDSAGLPPALRERAWPQIAREARWTAHHAESEHARRITSAALLQETLVFDGAVVGGGHLGPLVARVSKIDHLVHRDGQWEVRRERDPRTYAFTRVARAADADPALLGPMGADPPAVAREGNPHADQIHHITRAAPAPIDPAFFRPTPGELAAEPPGETVRRARVACVRELLGDPKEDDLAGHLAGAGAGHGALSSIHLTDVFHAPDGWHVTAGGKQLHFLDEDPATGVLFSLALRGVDAQKGTGARTPLLTRAKQTGARRGR